MTSLTVYYYLIINETVFYHETDFKMFLLLDLSPLFLFRSAELKGSVYCALGLESVHNLRQSLCLCRFPFGALISLTTKNMYKKIINPFKTQISDVLNSSYFTSSGVTNRAARYVKKCAIFHIHPSTAARASHITVYQPLMTLPTGDGSIGQLYDSGLTLGAAFG